MSKETFILPSNKVNEEFTMSYSNIVVCDKTTFTGYKVLRYSAGNYYSVTTGMFRYKKQFIDRTSPYSKLYENTADYSSEMEGHTAIFASKEDALKMIPNLIEEKENVHLVEIIISNNLISGDCENKFHNCKFIAGRNLVSIKKVNI